MNNIILVKEILRIAKELKRSKIYNEKEIKELADNYTDKVWSFINKRPEDLNYKVVGRFKMDGINVSVSFNDNWGSFSEIQHLNIDLTYIKNKNEVADILEHELLHMFDIKSQPKNNGFDISSFGDHEIKPYAITIMRKIDRYSKLKNLPIENAVKSVFKDMIKKGQEKPPISFINKVCDYIRKHF